MTKIKINCRKVYETGLRYEQDADNLVRIQRDLRMIQNNIQEIWQGQDSDVFTSKMDAQVQYLDHIINFLKEKGSLLKNTAKNHNDSDQEFTTRMKRSDLREE